MKKELLPDLYYPWSVTTRVVSSQIKEMSQAQSLTVPELGGNPINWQVGHLILSRSGVIRMLGAKMALPEGFSEAYGRGTGMREDQLLAFDLQSLHEEWLKSKDLLKAAIINIDPATLEESTSNGKSKLAMLNFYQFHESYHVGQIGFARRVLGLEGLIP